MAEADGDNEVDVLILGAGSGGYACALRAAQLGLSVALVEQSKLGGTCLHVGCIPTKALLHAAEIADSTREAETFGVLAKYDGIDAAGVRNYADGVVSRLFKGLTGLIKSRGIRVVEGRGTLTGPKQVTVEGTGGPDGTVTLTGRNVVLATGSAPRLLPGIEIDGTHVLTSDDALRLDRVPSPPWSSAAVSSVVSSRASGAASVPRSPSSRRSPGCCRPRTRRPRPRLERAFRKRGITSRTGTSVTGVTTADDGVVVTLSDDTELRADVLLVAVGRVPRTEDLGYEEHGVTLDRGFVTVDDHCRTGVDGVWAVGDIVPGLQLAHRGFQQGIFVAEQIAGLAPRPIDERGIPRVTYSRPEVASVGLTEEQAKEEYGDDGVTTLTYDLAGNGKSQILRTQGFVKLVRQVDGPVVGVHLVGERVGELIGEAQLVYGWEAHPDDVAPLVHAHPTQNEALGEAFLALAGKPLHAHS